MSPPGSALTLRHRSRALAPLGTVFLAVGVAVAFAYPFLSLFLTQAVHAGPLQLSAFLLAAPLSGVLVSSVLARLSDNGLARRRVLIIAAVAGCAGTGVTSVVRNYWLLLLVVCTLTATASALLAQGFAYARDVLAGDPAAPLMTSALRTCFSLAWVAGPPLASLLLDSGGFRLLYGSASAIYALVLLVVVFWLRDPVRLAAQDAHDAARQEAPRDAPARSLWLTIAALVLLQGAIGLNVQLVPLLVKANLHSDVRAAGVVLGVCAALEVPAMLGFGALSTRVPLRRLVLLGPLFGGVYYAIAAASAAVWQLGAAQVINACFIAIAQGLAISYVQELLPSRPGRASTLYSNTFAYGLMLASPLVGLGARYGYRMTYVAAVGLSAGGLGLLLAGRPRLPTATGDTPSREGVHTAAQPGA